MSKTSDARKARRNPPPAHYVRISEAAAATRTATSTVYKWIRTEQIPAIHHNGLLYVRIKDVKETRRTNKRSLTPLPVPPEDMVTTGHAALVTGAHQVSIQEWARHKRIRAERYGKKQWRWYVNLEDVKQMALTSKPGRQTCL